MSSDGGDAGLINHAVQAMSTAAGGGTIDMASVLAKIQSLEKEKQAMAATLDSNNARSVKKCTNILSNKESIYCTMLTYFAQAC
jgi:hypothetical protein